MENLAERRELKSRLLINLISIAVPVAVAVMLAFPNKLYLGDWTKSLAHVIGGINTLTTLVLIAGWIFIKQNKPNLHRQTMLTAFALGALFLVCYVTYHISNPANRFTGEGNGVRYVYFFFLVTHILLSIVVLPLVLRALFYALAGHFDRHLKIVKYAYPIWLYVSASGVIVYLLLYQLFPAK
jgi:putative membrane protein